MLSSEELTVWEKENYPVVFRLPTFLDTQDPLFFPDPVNLLLQPQPEKQNHYETKAVTVSAKRPT